MAVSSTFKERLEHMERTRDERLALLQAEKELQINKSQILESKLSYIRSIEQRCLKLDHKIASQKFIVSSLSSEIDRLDSQYLTDMKQFRVLKREVEELAELEKGKDSYFDAKTRDMNEFTAQAESFTTNCQIRVEELRNCLDELNSTFIQLQASTGYSNNSDLAEAETRKAELEAEKANLERTLASNYQIKAQLQRQLHSILISQKSGKENTLNEEKIWHPVGQV